MTKASDNAFPSILITEGTEPSAPAAGKQRLYIDSTSHHLMRTNSSGTETDIEASAGGVATDSIWDAAGDLVVGTGANTAARLAIGAAGGHVARINGAVAWDSGTSNPGSAATGDRYWRTDLRLEVFYDGTRWLSTTLYHDELTNSAAALSATGSIGNWTPWHTTYDLWMEDFWSSTDVQTTNDGSKFWTIEVRKYQSNFSTNTLIASRSTGAGPDSPSTMITAKTAIGALYTPGTFPIIQVGAVKTSTPGNLFGAYALTYRLVIP